jgi:ABC-2 type transport system permease protein
MLIGGLYFQQTGKIRWMYFGFFVGSIIGYFVAEMIVKKSFKVFKNIKGYAIYAIVMIIVIQGINFDVIGYEKKLPDVSQIESVYFSEYGYDLNQVKYNKFVYYDKNNLQTIHDLHKQIIEEKSQNKYGNRNQFRDIILRYKLKDGSTVARGYVLPIDNYSKYIKPIHESQEYKKMIYDVLNINPLDIEKITISSSTKINKQLVIIKPEDIKEAVEVLKQDVSNEKYEEMIAGNVPWGSIDFMVADNKLEKYPILTDRRIRGYEDKQAHMFWQKSYKLFEEWLNKKGYLDNSRVLPKDISYAVVEKIENQQRLEDKMNNDTLFNDDKVKKLNITDKNQIEACLLNYKYVGKVSGDKYIIGFYGTDKRNLEYVSFDDKNSPDFIKNYFNK